MTSGGRQRLDQLTRRWRARHDARLRADLPDADAALEARAAESFPFREMSPAAYADRHGDDMIGFTFDEHRYSDPELHAWLHELGRLLRARRRADG
ncbi:MAG TPA: hypothetical protein VHK63_06680 [Candidatus Limnocylindria bacterium]|nr:hypothetical protein [Candidatus Limnocylindria bacterium]